MSLKQYLFNTAKRLPFTVFLVHWIRNQPRDISWPERLQRFFFKATHKQAPLPPPTTEEQRLIDQLRSQIRLLPHQPKEGSSPAEKKWILFTQKLREKILSEDPRLFLSWDVIVHNMLYEARREDLVFLQSLPQWATFAAAMDEPPHINRQPFFALPHVSRNAVRQAFHLAQFMTTTGLHPNQFDEILDFGGGYGSMCRLIHRLGFHGCYRILDWPEFSFLQEFYMSWSGIESPITHDPTSTNGIVLLNAVKDIAHIAEPTTPRKTLFIATWSASETPVAFRKTLFKAIDPDAMLITYQKRFAEIDNITYFSEFIKDHPEMIWHHFPMSYIPQEQNHYLIGVRKT